MDLEDASLENPGFSLGPRRRKSCYKVMGKSVKGPQDVGLNPELSHFKKEIWSLTAKEIYKNCSTSKDFVKKIKICR